jgi:hypothetical protein
MYQATKPDGLTMISGKHAQRGTNRRLAYSAWYELVGARLYVTASIRYGDRTLATPDLESAYQSEAGSEEDAVAAALDRYIDETTFDFGVESEPSSKQQRDAALAPSGSARAAWAELRTSDWGR